VKQRDPNCACTSTAPLPCSAALVIAVPTPFVPLASGWQNWHWFAAAVGPWFAWCPLCQVPVRGGLSWHPLHAIPVVSQAGVGFGALPYATVLYAGSPEPSGNQLLNVPARTPWQAAFVHDFDAPSKAGAG
jgi:hypothetical protein